MPAIDAGVVFLPRFTTLVGATTFTTAPLDVSRQGGAQFQVFRGPIRVASGSGTLTLYLEESLDAQSWALGPATPQGITLVENVTQFFSYSFRLRWFRLRMVLAGTGPMVSCWAEGLLRGGDGGLWGVPDMLASGGPAGYVEAWQRFAGPTSAPSAVPVDALTSAARRRYVLTGQEQQALDAARHQRNMDAAARILEQGRGLL